MNLIPQFSQLPADLCWKGKVAYLAYHLSKEGYNPPPVAHIFLEKKYVREVWYPVGVIIARPHLIGHELQLVKGRVLLFTEEGEVEFEGPHAIQTQPGFQAVAYALTECLVRTVHPNGEEDRDVSSLEDKWFESEAKVLELGKAVHLRLEQKHKALEAA